MLGQAAFYINDSYQKKEKISFQLINNLIVLPVEVNGQKLSFILDTGVNNTILFNLKNNDSLAILNTKKIALRGLGKGDSVDALKSENNIFKINNIVSYNQTMYVILKDYFNLSSKMGTTIHGVIGYQLFKDFIVKINYNTQKIVFFNPKKFNYNKCKKCETIPFFMYRKKPFIKAEVQLDTVKNKKTVVVMLLDSGGSDALWLFENSKDDIKTPKHFFNDILGEGLSGVIYGNRSRVPLFKLGRFEIKQPTVSFLDTISSQNARKLKQRNGSIGGSILSKFKIWIDYKNRKLTLKKNASFKSEFNYNMSGLDIGYSGKQLVREAVTKNTISTNEGNNTTVNFTTNYSFKFKPSFVVNTVLENSPAYHAGMQKNDIIVKINGKPAYEFKMSDIINRLQERDKKKIRFTILRNNKEMNFEFRLKKKI